MHYLRLIGALTLAIGGFASLGGLGCSATGDIKAPPTVTTGGAHVGQGGTTSQDTSAGGSLGTGGVFVATGGAISCNDPEKACGSICVDTATSHDHCGDCNHPCTATQICVDGICGCPASNPDGDAGAVTDIQVCAGKCVDILSDRDYCGGCFGDICLYDRCVSGKCGCLPTDIRCGEHNECVDKLTDPNNCGGCGIKCGPFEDCEQGDCVEHCEQHNGKMCDGVCVDVMNNSGLQNCGDCGIKCPSDRFECKAGQCVCSASSVLATVMHCVDPVSQADLCVNTANDTRFCGNCETACEPGKSCVDGQCICSSTSLQCPQGCFDGTSDRNHCGSCDTVCDAGFRCVSSNCVCNENLNLCAGRCADYQNEPANCGGCGQACGAGQACTGGKCQCDAGLDLCGGDCFNLQTDAAHCGKCDTTCSSSQTCVAGQCTCGDALLACGQACVDAQNDALNCGECDKKCGATQMCQGGTCRTSILKAQSQSTGEAGSVLRFSMGICNTSSSAVNLNGYTMKYWYTADGASLAQLVDIRYAPPPLSSTNPTATAELLAIDQFRDKADAVLTLKFAAATLNAGACAGSSGSAIQIEIHTNNYQGSYSAQTTDYSYLAGTTLKDNQYITIYNPQGLLVWGLEPELQP